MAAAGAVMAEVEVKAVDNDPSPGAEDYSRIRVAALRFEGSRTTDATASSACGKGLQCGQKIVWFRGEFELAVYVLRPAPFPNRSKDSCSK